MARNRIGLNVDGLEDMIERLENVNGNLKNAVTDALSKSKELVTNKLLQDTNNGNFPAHGKYSTGKLKHSIDTNNSVKWDGMKASIKVGYNIKNGGLVSIFMMYGTPRYMKVQKLYNDVYGAKTKREVKQIQTEAINREIQERM